MKKDINTYQLIEAIKNLKQSNGFLDVFNYDLSEAYLARGYQLACEDIIKFIEEYK